ncbi:MAG: hypothetical protein QOF84_1842 [Streptomyces sp.]|jgi:hypothetical protein|nr:hypothetical protein [Streptomyces sp.]
MMRRPKPQPYDRELRVPLPPGTGPVPSPSHRQARGPLATVPARCVWVECHRSAMGSAVSSDRHDGNGSRGISVSVAWAEAWAIGARRQID